MQRRDGLHPPSRRWWPPDAYGKLRSLLDTGAENDVQVDLHHRPVGLVYLQAVLVADDCLAGQGGGRVRLRPSLTHQLLGERLQNRLPVDDAVLRDRPRRGVEGDRPHLGAVGHHRDERQMLEPVRRRLHLTERAVFTVVSHLHSPRCPAFGRAATAVTLPSPKALTNRYGRWRPLRVVRSVTTVCATSLRRRLLLRA